MRRRLVYIYNARLLIRELWKKMYAAAHYSELLECHAVVAASHNLFINIIILKHIKLKTIGRCSSSIRPVSYNIITQERRARIIFITIVEFLQQCTLVLLLNSINLKRQHCTFYTHCQTNSTRAEDAHKDIIMHSKIPPTLCALYFAN